MLEELASDSSVSEVWLVGSRANGTALRGSDWDLLVFSDLEPSPTRSRMAGVDVLWKGPSGNVLLEGQSEHYVFNFSDFVWIQTGRDRARYRGKRFNDVPQGVRDASVPFQSFVDADALRLWPCKAT